MTRQGYSLSRTRARKGSGPSAASVLNRELVIGGTPYSILYHARASAVSVQSISKACHPEPGRLLLANGGEGSAFRLLVTRHRSSHLR
jgi:hypothetical protein